MSLTTFIKRLIKDYFMIFGCIVLCSAVMTKGDVIMRRSEFIAVLLCALATDLSTFIIYSKSHKSETEIRIRMALHVIVLEAIVLAFGSYNGWLKSPLNTFLIIVEVLIVYVVVLLASWSADIRLAKSINAKLKELKMREDAEEKEE